MRQILNSIQKGVVAYLAAKRTPMGRKMAAHIAWSTIENCRRSFVKKSDYAEVLVRNCDTANVPGRDVGSFLRGK